MEWLQSAAVASANDPPKAQVNRKSIKLIDVTRPDLSLRIAKLATTRNPRDSFEAYNIIMGCIWARGDAPENPNAPEFERITAACGNITREQLANRLPLVRQAAYAGVPLAALRLTDEGPDGNKQILIDRPDDPAVIAWRKEMTELIEVAAMKGDFVSMGSLASMYEHGSGVIGQQDSVKALQYATAMWELHKHVTGKLSNYSANELSKLSAALTPSEAQKAREDGLIIASKALEGMGHE